MTKNSLFSCFMAVFMSYCQEFCGSKMIYMFESHDQAIVVFAYYGRFHELLPIFLGFQGDLTWPQDTIHVWGHDQKLVIFVFYGRFHELSHIVLGFQGDLHVWELWPKTRRFCVLWPFSWVIAHNIKVPGQFKMTGGPDTCLRAWPKTRHFRFLWPSSWEIAHSFGVPRRFTCLRVMTKHSFVFAFYVRFHKLLPIILGYHGYLKWP